MSKLLENQVIRSFSSSLMSKCMEILYTTKPDYPSLSLKGKHFSGTQDHNSQPLHSSRTTPDACACQERNVPLLACSVWTDSCLLSQPEEQAGFVYCTNICNC